jgi:tetratricopeptide (TPR) repeat protein
MRALRVSLGVLALVGAAAAGEPDPVERLRDEQELRRRRAQLARLTERLRSYERQLEALEATAPDGPQPEPSDAPVLVRSDTDRDSRAIYAIEADRATLRAVLDHLSAEARLELTLDAAVSHRDLSALVSVALEGITLRGALDLLLGRFGLEYTISDETVVVAPPSLQGYRTAAERLRRQAQLAYQSALVRFPDHSDAARAHLLLGRHFLRRKLYPQAVEQLKRLLRDYPRAKEAPEALDALARAYAALGDSAKAAATWRSLVGHYPKHELADNALLALARQAQADGRPAEALPLLREVVARYADGDVRPEAEVLLAEALLAVNRHKQAVQRFERLLGQGLSPEAERRTRLLLARALMGQGMPTRAREAYYHLAQRFPDSPEGIEAQYGIGDTYHRERNTLLAVEAYRRALAKAPEAPQAAEARMRLAGLYRQMTLHDLAIALYEKLLAQQPPADRRPAILAALGECYYERGSYQKAQLTFARAATGGDATAWRAALGAGQAALADGRPADALPFLERVTKLAQDKRLVARAYDALGDCYRRLARYDDALAAYEAAAALAPDAANDSDKDKATHANAEP